MFDDVDTDLDSGPPPEESNNRTFVIAAGILGAITLLALICMAVYAVWWVPRSRTAQQTEVAQVETQNALDLRAMTLTFEASRATATQPATATATRTEVPTRTPIAVITETPTSVVAPQEDDPRTATVAALLTQAAEQTETVVPVTSPTTIAISPSPTALPDTGFADDFGVPGLMTMAIVLVAIIFLVRRMRMAAS